MRSFLGSATCLMLSVVGTVAFVGGCQESVYQEKDKFAGIDEGTKAKIAGYLKAAGITGEIDTIQDRDDHWLVVMDSSPPPAAPPNASGGSDGPQMPSAVSASIGGGGIGGLKVNKETGEVTDSMTGKKP